MFGISFHEPEAPGGGSRDRFVREAQHGPKALAGLEER